MDARKEMKDALIYDGDKPLGVYVVTDKGNLVQAPRGSLRAAVGFDGEYIAGLKAGWRMATQKDYDKAHAAELNRKADSQPKPARVPKKLATKKPAKAKAE